MRTILIILLALILIASTAYVIFQKAYDHVIRQLDHSHIGRAVLREPARQAHDNIYSVSDIEKLEGHDNFDRILRVYGLTLIIHKDMTEEFVQKIVDTFVSIFPRTDEYDLIKQEEVLQNMYQYKAALAIVKNEKALGDIRKLQEEYSVCDIIMEVDVYQENEVLEHLLHTITDVGLHYTFHDTWGLENSVLQSQMNKSIENKTYDIKDYGTYHEVLKNRILVQEYAYWVISSIWDFQETYGNNGWEWTLNSYEKISKSQPDLITLYDSTIKSVMRAPSQETLDAYK